jgi:hypothetical protein
VKKQLNKGQLVKVVDLTNKDFDLGFNELVPNDYQAFLGLLTIAVQNLIDSDFEKFLNALYRIDIDEQKVKEAFANERNVAATIAELIIQREIQKIKTREKYRSY